VDFLLHAKVCWTLFKQELFAGIADELIEKQKKAKFVFDN